jgi:hypothetical protein
MRAKASSRVAENKGQVAPKFEQLRGSAFRFRWEGAAFQVCQEAVMVRDDHVGCSGAGGF